MLYEKILENINTKWLATLGISYDEYSKLPIEDQQRILNEYRIKNQKRINKESNFVMNGYGEHSIFVDIKKGEEVMVRYGNFIEAGLTQEEEQRRLEDDIDNIIYCAPIAFIRKIQRRIRKR